MRSRARDGRRRIPAFIVGFVVAAIGVVSAQLPALHTGLVNSYNCDLNRYGELEAIVNGATSTVGSIRDERIRGLARRLKALAPYRISLAAFAA